MTNGLNLNNSTNSSHTEESSVHCPAHLSTKQNIKKRRNFSISTGEQDAAIALLMVHGPFQHAGQILNSMDVNSSSRQQRSAKKARKLPIKKRLLQNASAENFSSPTITWQEQEEGISFDEINENDVLCAGAGEGILLSSKRPGNLKFRRHIHSKLKHFMTSKGKLSKVQLAQCAVSSVNEATPKGRFLSMNKMTGLWYEVRQEKAWSKAIRTFMAHAQEVVEHQKAQKLQQQPQSLLTLIQNKGREGVAVPTKLTKLVGMGKHVVKVYKPVEQPTLVIPKVIPTRLSNITTARRA
mmetsp:Transcript_4930/g.7479  ORF Transcript_4930/g.7479 Transcript_4930/m.7479 type:complete len:296 (+) Transcript_4930:150-1037(+)|eukprot:CAMPEP_0195282458 /NCGR_PEP_ID=MMETSP0707-20130614/1316_1 /TAXON_ID=33640 /ORGANISM="Asterionellopsis glacialis, Strain CCMP134" /LENGTH=295 /DNA_ID=CAMNT_0040341425 /DNA_START=46 /DNA_END=933 /DNA_ORIENTATION=-